MIRGGRIGQQKEAAHVFWVRPDVELGNGYGMVIVHLNGRL